MYMSLISVSLPYFCTYYLIFFRDSGCNQTAVRKRSEGFISSFEWQHDCNNQYYQLRPNWSCSGYILYFSCTLFNMGKLRLSVFIKLKIYLLLFLNNIILHFMSLIMPQYNVHINTSESKFLWSWPKNHQSLCNSILRIKNVHNIMNKTSPVPWRNYFSVYF